MPKVQLPYRLTVVFTLVSLLLVILLGAALYLEWTRDWSQPLYAADHTGGDGAAGGGGGLIARGEALFQEYSCAGCHTTNGQGGSVGPDLQGVTTRFERDWLQQWLADPPAVKPGTIMPNLGLKPADIDALLAYMETLK